VYLWAHDVASTCLLRDPACNVVRRDRQRRGCGEGPRPRGPGCRDQRVESTVSRLHIRHFRICYLSARWSRSRVNSRLKSRANTRSCADDTIRRDVSTPPSLTDSELGIPGHHGQTRPPSTFVGDRFRVHATSRRMHAHVHGPMELLAPPSLNCLPPPISKSPSPTGAWSYAREIIAATSACLIASLIRGFFGSRSRDLSRDVSVLDCLPHQGLLWLTLERSQPRRQRACLELRQAGGTG
jgi:hypothetical protein